MNWLTTALFTIIFYSLFDLFLKFAAGKINDNLGAAIINITSFIVAVSWFWLRYQFGGEQADITKPGLIYSIIAGVFVGLASIFFIRLFALGVNLSVGVPLVRVGMIVLGSLFGVLLLKEGINLRYLLGFGLSILGMYLVMTAK
jgi:uncharacterized membrane protein